jgi:hypothetical protein
MEQLVNRAKSIVDLCWDSFSAKVGCGLISINKEASMQLEFAYLLKQSLNLAIHQSNESVNIELETSINIPIGYKECDIVIKLSKEEDIRFIPIELKCHKQFQPNGNPTGGYTQFRRHVHTDLYLLEQYALLESFTTGISLVMTDFNGIVNRNGFWESNICNGTTIQNGIIANNNYQQTEPTTLTNNYVFNWQQVGDFYFLKLEAND